MKLKKKHIITLSIVGVLIVLVASVYFTDRAYKKSLYEKSQKFSVQDTTQVTKLFFADKSGNQVTLTRTDNGWTVNDRYRANQYLINQMLSTLYNLRIQQPVSNKQKDNIIKQMAGSNVKVEVYENLPRINLYNKIKWLYRETCSKVFYVGGTTQNNIGTYFYKDGDEDVYIVHIPSLNGSISSRFTASEVEWRDHHIFESQIGDIASVKLEINDDPDNGFVISNVGRNQFVMTRLNGDTIDYNDAKMLKLLMKFRDIRFEAFLNDVEPARRDSIINSPVQQRLTLITKDGKSRTVTTFRMRSNDDMYAYSEDEINNPDFEKMINDPDHKYALLSEGNEFVLIQDFVFGDLLKPAYYYSKEYKDEIPQVYYKELETVESR